MPPARPRAAGARPGARGISGLASGKEGGGRAARGASRRRWRADLIHLEVVVDTILTDNVKGGFTQAGVFRGGACIMLRGLLNGRDCKVARRRLVRGYPAAAARHRGRVDGQDLGSRLDPTFDWVDRFVASGDLVRYNRLERGRARSFLKILQREPPVFGSTSTERPVT